MNLSISLTMYVASLTKLLKSSIIDNTKQVYNHLRYYQKHVSVSLLPDHLTTCLLTSQLYNIHPGAAKRSIRSAGPSPVLYHQGAAFCAPNFPSQTPLEPEPGWQPDSPAAEFTALAASGQRRQGWRPERGEAEMVCGETLQAGGNHQLGLDKTVCGAVSFELRLNFMRIIGCPFFPNIFSHGLFIHWPALVPSPMTGLSLIISSIVNTFPGTDCLPQTTGMDMADTAQSTIFLQSRSRSCHLAAGWFGFGNQFKVSLFGSQTVKMEFWHLQKSFYRYLQWEHEAL